MEKRSISITLSQPRYSRLKPCNSALKG
uniref:Uncharacterized protein n=1 Tax=Arundo donax TaxID=35708 RepID=A0A0A8XWB8_ARUDO